MNSKKHLKAVLQALFVTFLWSTSWVLIKMGLRTSLPAITFAGLRYFAAFLCLLPFVLFNPRHRRAIRSISRATWIQLILLGIFFYALAQGAQFVSLAFLPAATLSLILNFSPIFIALPSGLINKEPASIFQWGGILLSVAGAAIYFFPPEIHSGQMLGLAVALIGLLANSGSALLGRKVNHQSGLPPMLITAVSMGIGGFLLLVTGITTQGMGRLDLTSWFIVGWLAIVNTAVAFTLWNNSLRTLTAVESGVINNTMLPQIALLAWLFLGEPLNSKQVLGIILVVIGTWIVQAWRNRSKINKQAVS